MEAWWTRLRSSLRDELISHQRAVVEGFDETRRCRELAEEALRRWIIRHNKGTHWVGTEIERRRRIDGAALTDAVGGTGLPVPADQLLPFFLAARSAVNPGKDLLGDALCSSYEAFRNTREQRDPERDDHDSERDNVDLTHSPWCLQEFDAALTRFTGKVHPKIAATVRKVVDLWEAGKKVLVFAFYRQTCAALRIHISEEIRRRTAELARRRLIPAGKHIKGVEVEQVLERIQDRYFDAPEVPGRRALDRALRSIVNRRRSDLIAKGVQEQDLAQVVDVMRRFLRVPTTLVRCFPLGEHEVLEPAIAVERLLDSQDDSKVTWRGKFEAFVDFLTGHCSATERVDYLEAASGTRTGGIRADADLMTVEGKDDKESIVTVANVQVATGRTRRDTRLRLMRAFNTPFFPDIFVCSQVMGEGVGVKEVAHYSNTWCNPGRDGSSGWPRPSAKKSEENSPTIASSHSQSDTMGSSITATPCFRIRTSSPCIRNCLGSRTAWERPDQNNLAVSDIHSISDVICSFAIYHPNQRRFKLSIRVRHALELGAIVRATNRHIAVWERRSRRCTDRSAPDVNAAIGAAYVSQTKGSGSLSSKGMLRSSPAAEFVTAAVAFPTITRMILSHGVSSVVMVPSIQFQ